MSLDPELLREERLKLEKKLSRSFGSKEFLEEVMKEFEEKDLSALEFRAQRIAEHKQSVISQQKSDEDLKKAKKVVSGLNAPYNEQKRAADTKMRLIGLMIQEMKGFETEES
jgi:hypothetical protein